MVRYNHRISFHPDTLRILYRFISTSVYIIYDNVWSEWFEKDLGMVQILPLVCIRYLELTFSSLKQLIHDQP